MIMALAMDVSLFSLFFIILFGYCTVKVVFSNIKRGGIMLCQIAVGSLYLFGIPRGYTDGFYSWCKQVIATCLTAFFADNYPLSRTADLHSTRSACGWYLLVGNGSSEDRADVWAGHFRKSQYDEC